MKKTPAKFQKDWYKTVRGVALIRMDERMETCMPVSPMLKQVRQKVPSQRRGHTLSGTVLSNG